MSFRPRLSIGAVELISTLPNSQKWRAIIRLMWTNSGACSLVIQPKSSYKLSKKRSKRKHHHQKMTKKRRLMTLLYQNPVLKSNHLHKTSWSLTDWCIQSELSRLTARQSQSVPTRWHLLMRWDTMMSSKDYPSRTLTALLSINISEIPCAPVSRRWWWLKMSSSNSISSTQSVQITQKDAGLSNLIHLNAR